MKQEILILLITLFNTSVFVQATSKPYQIIPEPQSIIYTEGELTLKPSLKIAYPATALNEAKLLQKYLAEDFGIKARLVKNINVADIGIKLTTTSKVNNQSTYLLKVAKKVNISSTSNAGILYGIQSLRQIIKKKDNNFVIQQGTITDYSAFSWRSFMLDEARHFKGKQVVKNLLDEMALLKMNVFHWHLVDDQGWRIEIKKYPKLTEIGAYRDSTEIYGLGKDKVIYDGKPHSGFYTQADIKDVVDYATKLHIQVMPEIEMPGHASAAVAAYPWLGATGKQIKVPGAFGVFLDVYNITDPQVIAFFDDVINEIITIFPSPIIHIGGDEVRYEQWNESKKVKQYMDKNGLKSATELQVFFTNTISNLLKNKGKRMMGWNEIMGDNVHSYQKNIDSKSNYQKLAEGTIVQFWRGDSTLIQKTINKGYEMVNSNNEFTYLDYDYKSIPLSKAYAFNPIPTGLPKDKEGFVIGLGCQMWSETIPTVESMNYKIFPRIAAYAECGWTSPKNKSYERFEKALPFMLNHWKSKGIIYGQIMN